MRIEDQKKIKKSHKRILVSVGFYAGEEIEMYLADLESEKFLNLEDAIPQIFINKRQLSPAAGSNVPKLHL